MSKTTQELAASKAGSTTETNGMGAAERPFRPGGLYRLTDENGETVDEQIVKSHPRFGDGQAAAFERVGYKFVRPARKGEVKDQEITPVEVIRSGEASAPASSVESRLAALEKENADLRASMAAESTRGASDNDVRSDEKEAAKANGGAPTDTGEGNPALDGGEDDEAPVEAKPLEKQNKTELVATAEAEGVELDLEGAHDTNKKIAEAIQTARG